MHAPTRLVPDDGTDAGGASDVSAAGAQALALPVGACAEADLAWSAGWSGGRDLPVKPSASQRSRAREDDEDREGYGRPTSEPRPTMDMVSLGR